MTIPSQIKRFSCARHSWTGPFLPLLVPLPSQGQSVPDDLVANHPNGDTTSGIPFFHERKSSCHCFHLRATQMNCTPFVGNAIITNSNVFITENYFSYCWVEESVKLCFCLLAWSGWCFINAFPAWLGHDILLCCSSKLNSCIFQEYLELINWRLREEDFTLICMLFEEFIVEEKKEKVEYSGLDLWSAVLISSLFQVHSSGLPYVSDLAINFVIWFGKKFTLFFYACKSKLYLAILI